MAFKRMRFSESMEAEIAKTNHAAVTEYLGREIHVFSNSASSLASNKVSASSNDEPDDFYDLTPEDYYEIMSHKIEAQYQFLHTCKIQNVEAAACREGITKAVIRVCFPDGNILEAEFQLSEKLQSLVDLLIKVVARPDLPFYLYTSPPKKRIEDMSKDFYVAGFAPGAIVYFSYDLPKEFDSADTKTGPYLRDDIVCELSGSNS